MHKNCFLFLSPPIPSIQPARTEYLFEVFWLTPVHVTVRSSASDVHLWWSSTLFIDILDSSILFIVFGTNDYMASSGTSPRQSADNRSHAARPFEKHDFKKGRLIWDRNGTNSFGSIVEIIPKQDPIWNGYINYILRFCCNSHRPKVYSGSSSGRPGRRDWHLTLARCNRND